MQNEIQEDSSLYLTKKLFTKNKMVFNIKKIKGKWSEVNVNEKKRKLGNTKKPLKIGLKVCLTCKSNL